MFTDKHCHSLIIYNLSKMLIKSIKEQKFTDKHCVKNIKIKFGKSNFFGTPRDMQITLRRE